MNAYGAPSYVFKVFLFFMLIALCLFEYLLFRYSAIVRESEVLLLDSSVEWILFATIAVWSLLLIVFRFKSGDVWLVGLLLIAIFMFFNNYLFAFEPAKALVLLAGVALGKGIVFFLDNENSYCVSSQSFTRVQANGIRRDLILILIFQFSLASWCHLDMTGSFYHGPRWTGLWDSPNTYGMLMGTGLTLAAGLLMADLELNGVRRKFMSFFLLLAAGMMACGLARSYSRGAWIGVTVGLLYLANAYGRFNWRYVLPGFLMAIAAVCFFWNGTSDSSSWYVKRMDLSRASAQHRISAWKAGVEIMRDHPFGVGWNETVDLYGKSYLPPEDGAPAITTNDYLMLGTQLGIPGLLCFLAYVALCFSGAASTDGSQKPARGNALEIGHKPTCRAGALAMLVAFWFDDGLFELPTAAVFWILLESGSKRPPSKQSHRKQPDPSPVEFKTT